MLQLSRLSFVSPLYSMTFSLVRRDLARLGVFGYGVLVLYAKEQCYVECPNEYNLD